MSRERGVMRRIHPDLERKIGDLQRILEINNITVNKTGVSKMIAENLKIKQKKGKGGLLDVEIDFDYKI